MAHQDEIITDSLEEAIQKMMDSNAPSTSVTHVGLDYDIKSHRAQLELQSKLIGYNLLTEDEMEEEIILPADKVIPNAQPISSEPTEPIEPVEPMLEDDFNEDAVIDEEFLGEELNEEFEEELEEPTNDNFYDGTAIEDDIEWEMEEDCQEEPTENYQPQPQHEIEDYIPEAPQNDIVFTDDEDEDGVYNL